MGRAERVTAFIKSHDPKLFCKNTEGKLCIYRKSWKWDLYDVDGQDYLFVRPADHFIIALTKDWRFKSEPVDWGLLPILFRLKEIDCWNRDLAEEAIKQEEKRLESLARDRQNNNEAFLKDFRRQFARTFNDVNTSLMKKDNRRKKEKENGYN